MDRRVFLRNSGAAIAVAGAPAWAAQAAPEFRVERAGGERLKLCWAGMAGPVRLYASSDPSAPAALMRALPGVRRSQETETEFAAAPRPYFLIESGDVQLRAGERVLPLQGAANFRDLGGYQGAGGRHVRWGLLYHSAALDGLTEADYDYLRHLNIDTVCDFRSAEERVAAPTHWPNPDAPVVVSADYSMATSMRGMGDIRTLRTGDEARAAFARAYADFPVMLATQYRHMFQIMASRTEPMLCHCTAGKDRTGVASALILSVLGVSREDVLADYALTGMYMMRRGGDAHSSVTANPMVQMPSGVMQVFMGSDPAVLAQALALIDAEYGSPVAMLKARYEFSDDMIIALQNAYLE